MWKCQALWLFACFYLMSLTWDQREQTPMWDRGPVHISAVFTHGLCWSHCWFNAWPCERNGQKSHIRSAWQVSPEVMTRTFTESSTGWASTPWCFQATTGSEFSNIFPAKKVSLWKTPSCLHHVLFPAASETLHGYVEVSEETWVTVSCRRSRPLEPVPSKWGWGIYSPPSAHTLFLPTAVWVFCVVSAEISNMRAECVPVPCLLLFFQDSHLWTRARFPPAQGVWMSWVQASGGRGCPWGAEGNGAAITLEGSTNQPTAPVATGPRTRELMAPRPSQDNMHFCFAHKQTYLNHHTLYPLKILNTFSFI